MITRRCNERMFLLGADPVASDLFVYCLAEAMESSGVLVHAAVVMSNHVHIVVTDVRGTLPDFCKALFCQWAKAINTHTGHAGSVFVRNPRYSAVELVTEAAVVREIAYLLSNPGKANLVEKAEHWPGFISSAEDMRGERVLVGRAGGNPYLKCRGRRERQVRFVVPPMVQDADIFIDAVRKEQLRLEAAAREKRRKEGRGVKGADAVRKEKWYRRPKGGTPMFELNPTIAAARRAERIAALVALKSWRARYVVAACAFRRGRRNVMFPYGTWGLVRFCGVRVAAPPLACAA